MLQEIFYLRLNSSACSAEAWVNGVSVSRVDPVTCLLDGRPVHEFLLPGKNHLALLVSPGPHPSHPMSSETPFPAPPRAYASLHLLRGPRGVLPDDPQVKVLAAIEWRPETGAIVRPPVYLEAEADLPVWLPRWSWLDATPVGLSNELNNIVFRFIGEMVIGMRKGDPSLYIQSAATRFQEVGQAYGLTADEARNNFLAQWAKINQIPGFAIQLPNREAMALRVCADGRLIECLDLQFEPMLRAEKLEADGRVPIRYTTRLAFFGRDIRIVR